MRLSLTFAVVLLLVCQVYSQQLVSSESAERAYDQAQESYQLGAYAAAAELFDTYRQQAGNSARIEAGYYEALARLKAGYAGGISAMERFIADNPGHPLAGNGYFVLGNHYFDQGEYDQAIAFYDQVSKSLLSVADQEMWLFRRGYAYVASDQPDLAKRDFEQVLDYRGVYFTDASYYLGSLYFKEKAYNQALGYLEPIDGKSEEYAEDVVLMIATVYFQTTDYAKLYAYGASRLTNKTTETNKQLNKLLGEAGFNQKDYPKAAQYLQQYVTLSNKKVSAETYFKLGYAYFQLENNDKAIDNFKLSGLEKGAMGQASSFYLGQLYLKKGNYNFAYSAFKNVAESDWNPDAKEESAFTLGKINVSRGQYADAVADLSAFIETYPNSRWSLEANEYLADAYLNTSNYDQAIEHLEAIPNKSIPLKKAYQKVTFQKGQLLFNDSKFDQAKGYFEKSVTYPMDVDLASEAWYLKGECLSLIGDYPNAITAYQRSIGYGIAEWAKRSRYGLAYVYYNEKEYAKAEEQFKSYLNAARVIELFYADAQLRLADCYYVQKKYDQAIALYARISKPEFHTYVNYQLGLVYRMNGNSAKAKAAFQVAGKDQQSEYADNALFQLAELYIEETQFNQALEQLDQLIFLYPQSGLLPYAKTRQALCYYNLGQYAKAKEAYVFVLEHYINHETANAALLGLQEVMKKGEPVPDFESYLAAYQKANPEDSSLEVIAFEAAKTSYYNQKYDEAVRKLEAFLTKYPDSGSKDDAVYFLADSYYRAGSWQKAADEFMVLINGNNPTYVSRALDKRGKALISALDYKGAVKNYRMLAASGSSRKETYLAQEGLMKAYLELGKSDSALYFADQILQSDWKPADAENATWLVKGKILLKQQKYQAALDELMKVVNGSKSEEGAEAKYLMGKAYYLQEQYKSSLEILFDLNKNYASYPYWIGKSFLLIADNYLKMGELLQARATTKSIVENATIPEIVNEAQAKLLQIQQEEDRVIVADTLRKGAIK